MKLAKITEHLEQLAPRAYAEDFDNVGLLVGDPACEVSKLLITLDCNEAVIDEAIKSGANAIITFHPIIFKGLKRLTGNNYVERVVMKAIRHDIAIYAIHTNLDFASGGSNQRLASILNLQAPRVLVHKPNTIKKLTTYVPTASLEQVRNALFKAGAGNIGNYSQCSFKYDGQGSFCGDENSNPVVGQIGQLHLENESCLNVILPAHIENKVIAALKQAHPYEEVAYEMVQLENKNQDIGIGMVGKLSEPMHEQAFLEYVKSKIPTGCIRHSALRGKPIKKVAVLGGAGSFAIHAAKSAGADAFVSADFKYHDFFQADNQLLICDVGHYESEQHIPAQLKQYLSEYCNDLPIELSQAKTNPVHYY